MPSKSFLSDFQETGLSEENVVYRSEQINMAALLTPKSGMVHVLFWVQTFQLPFLTISR